MILAPQVLVFQKGSAHFFCKELGNKYFRLWKPRTVFVTYSSPIFVSTFKQLFKNVNTTCSAQGQNKSQMRPVGYNLTTSVLIGKTDKLHYYSVLGFIIKFCTECNGDREERHTGTTSGGEVFKASLQEEMIQSKRFNFLSEVKVIKSQED